MRGRFAQPARVFICYFLESRICASWSSSAFVHQNRATLNLNTCTVHGSVVLCHLSPSPLSHSGSLSSPSSVLFFCFCFVRLSPFHLAKRYVYGVIWTSRNSVANAGRRSSLILGTCVWGSPDWSTRRGKRDASTGGKCSRDANGGVRFTRDFYVTANGARGRIVYCTR